MPICEDGSFIPNDDPLLQKARGYVQNGKRFLETHVPGWLERAQRSSVFEMITHDYCALAIACKGEVLRGRRVYSAGDVSRSFPELNLGKAEFGFYATELSPVTYEHLQIAWEEVFGRGVCLRVAA
jgi:hypothetical protein